METLWAELAAFYVWSVKSLTIWTLLATAIAFFARLNKETPRLLYLHPLCFFVNDKYDILYKRPTYLEVLCFFAIGLVPLVNVLFFGGCAIFMGKIVFSIFLERRRLRNGRT